MVERNTSTKTTARPGIISETIAELKKVTWLKWPNEALYLTTLVLIVTIAVGIVLGVIDFGFGKFVNILIGR